MLEPVELDVGAGGWNDFHSALNLVAPAIVELPLGGSSVIIVAQTTSASPVRLFEMLPLELNISVLEQVFSSWQG